MNFISKVKNNRLHTVVLLVFIFIIALVLFGLFNRVNDGDIPDNCIEIEDNGETILECDTDREVDVSEFEDITSLLPIRRYNYEIHFESPMPGEDTLPIVITVLPREFPIPPEGVDTSSQQYQNYLEYVKRHRSAAENEFNELDFDRSRYSFYYSEDFAIDDFDGQLIDNL